MYRRLWWLGWMLVLVACRGKPTAVTPHSSPSPTPFRPAVRTASVGLTPAYTPTGVPAFSPTSTPTPELPRFAGRCTPETKALCLYTAGWGRYRGRRMLKYVFENVPYPEAFRVRINGAELACVQVPEYPKRLYCFGLPLASLTGRVRIRITFFFPDGRVLPVVVPETVLERLARELPVYWPLQPTATPTWTPTPFVTATPTAAPPSPTPAPTSTPPVPSPTPGWTPTPSPMPPTPTPVPTTSPPLPTPTPMPTPASTPTPVPTATP